MHTCNKESTDRSACRACRTNKTGWKSTKEPFYSVPSGATSNVNAITDSVR